MPVPPSRMVLGMSRAHLHRVWAKWNRQCGRHDVPSIATREASIVADRDSITGPWSRDKKRARLSASPLSFYYRTTATGSDAAYHDWNSTCYRCASTPHGSNSTSISRNSTSLDYESTPHRCVPDQQSCNSATYAAFTTDADPPTTAAGDVCVGVEPVSTP